MALVFSGVVTTVLVGLRRVRLEVLTSSSNTITYTSGKFSNPTTIKRVGILGKGVISYSSTKLAGYKLPKISTLGPTNTITYYNLSKLIGLKIPKVTTVGDVSVIQSSPRMVYFNIPSNPSYAFWS